MKRKYWILSMMPICLISLLIPWNNAELKPSEYISYVNDPENGCTIIARKEGIKYEMTYLPVVYQIIQKLNKTDISHSEKTASRLSIINGMKFRFKLHREDGGYNPFLLTTQTNSNGTKYMANENKGLLMLINGKDTITPDFIHFDGAYTALSSATASCSFPVLQRDLSHSDSFSLLYLTGKGNDQSILFEFNSEDLLQLPALKII